MLLLRIDRQKEVLPWFYFPKYAFFNQLHKLPICVEKFARDNSSTLLNNGAL